MLGLIDSHYLLTVDFYCSKVNPSLFIYKNGDVRILLLAYVDDVIVVNSNANLIESLITQLDQEFALKHLGTLHYFLGLEVKYFVGGLFLEQTKYT